MGIYFVVLGRKLRAMTKEMEASKMCWWIVGHRYEFTRSLYPRELQVRVPGAVYERFSGEVYECEKCKKKVTRRAHFHLARCTLNSCAPS